MGKEGKDEGTGSNSAGLVADGTERVCSSGEGCLGGCGTRQLFAIYGSF